MEPAWNLEGGNEAAAFTLCRSLSLNVSDKYIHIVRCRWVPYCLCTPPFSRALPPDCSTCCLTDIPGSSAGVWLWVQSGSSPPYTSRSASLVVSLWQPHVLGFRIDWLVSSTILQLSLQTFTTPASNTCIGSKSCGQSYIHSSERSAP